MKKLTELLKFISKRLHIVADHVKKLTDHMKFIIKRMRFREDHLKFEVK